MHQVSPGDKEALVFRKCFHDVCKIPSVAFQAYAWVQFKVSVKMFPPKKTLHFLGAEKMDFAFKRTVFFYGLTIRQVELHLRFTPEIGRLNSTICGTALRQLKSLSGDMQPRDLLRGHGADSTI